MCLIIIILAFPFTDYAEIPNMSAKKFHFVILMLLNIAAGKKLPSIRTFLVDSRFLFCNHIEVFFIAFFFSPFVSCLLQYTFSFGESSSLINELSYLFCCKPILEEMLVFYQESLAVFELHRM